MSAKKTAKTAIITRTKNRNLLLERAIKSVLSQTDKDYVHVILNDGGDEKALKKILDKYPDKNRVLVSNKKSVGITKALNQAIKSVDSEYVTILDDDDSWHKNRLSASMEAFSNKPNSMMNVVKMDIVEEEFDEESGGYTAVRQYLHPESGDGEISLFKRCVRNYLSNGAVMYRRKLYDELGGYDESLPVGEDWDFGIKTILRYDVQLIKTDSSMVNYSQRISVQNNDEGTSVIQGVATQEETINVIRNKYLREDISNGKLGPGFIMNLATWDLANVVRLEGHINSLEQRLNDNYESAKHEVLGNSVFYRIKRAIKSDR